MQDLSVVLAEHRPGASDPPRTLGQAEARTLEAEPTEMRVVHVPEVAACSELWIVLKVRKGLYDRSFDAGLLERGLQVVGLEAPRPIGDVSI